MSEDNPFLLYDEFLSRIENLKLTPMQYDVIIAAIADLLEL